MKDVPTGFLGASSSRSGSVIAKAVDHRVPDWPKMRYEEAFRQSNPNGHDDEVSTTKVGQLQVAGLFDRFCVVHKSSVQLTS